MKFLVYILLLLTAINCASTANEIEDISDEEVALLNILHGSHPQAILLATATVRWAIPITPYASSIVLSKMRNIIVIAEQPCLPHAVPRGRLNDCLVQMKTGAIGACIVQTDGYAVITKSYIAISSKEMNRKRLTESQKLATLVHEIGHCLGLKHSADPVDIMFPTATDVQFPSTEEQSQMMSAYKHTEEWENSKVFDPYNKFHILNSRRLTQVGKRKFGIILGE